MRDYRLVEDSTLCPPWCLSLSATGLLRKEEPGFLRKLLNRSIVKYSDHDNSLCNVANRLFFFYLFAVISRNTNPLFLFVYYSFTNVVCLGPYIKRETGN